MDPQAGPSHLSEAQPSDVTISIPPQPGHPTEQRFRANAHYFEIHDSHFYDIRGGFHHAEKTGNQQLLDCLLPS